MRKLNEREKAKMNPAFKFVYGRARLTKQITHIVTWPLVKKSFKLSFAIIGAISTIMGVAGISLIDLLPKDSGCLFRLFALVILFVLLAFFAAIATYHHSKDGVHLLINGMDVDIVVDDLFGAEGVKVIPFDEYFDIKVDDKVISKNSLNGIFVEKYADQNVLKQVVEERQPSLLKPYKAGDGRICYPLGTVKDCDDFALLAFTHMDEVNRAYLHRGQYEECLLNMWDELDRMYAGRRIVLPLLGSGITRFENGKPSEDDLLRCMLCTLRASQHHFKEGVVVVLTEKTAARMRLYEVNGYTEAWDNRIGEKNDL